MEENNNAAQPNQQQEKKIVNDAKQMKCAACGGMMRFSPRSANLKCIYCGQEQKIDLTPVPLKGNDYEHWAHAAQVQDCQEIAPVNEIKCHQCGATTTIPEHVTSASCPFCGTSLILTEAHSSRFWKPEYILPFAIEKLQGMEAYKKWLGSRWFLPSQVKKNGVDPEAFKGIYMPYWAYDAFTHTTYQGERGERHTRTVQRDGKEETESYIEWYDTWGEVDVDFDNVLVPASNTFPPQMLKGLKQWDLDNCVKYSEDFLSGFVTELYQKDFKQAYQEAKDEMDDVIDNAIRRDIGGAEQRINSHNTTIEDLAFKHLLLPVWISSFRYNDKLYQFVVNGRTGEVEGEFPLSKAKIAATIVAAVIAIIILYYLTR